LKLIFLLQATSLSVLLAWDGLKIESSTYGVGKYSVSFYFASNDRRLDSAGQGTVVGQDFTDIETPSHFLHLTSPEDKNLILSNPEVQVLRSSTTR